MSLVVVLIRLVILESGLEYIFAGLGLEIKGLVLRLAVFGRGLGPYWTCYKAHSLQACFAAYNDKFIDNIVTVSIAISMSTVTYLLQYR